MRKLLVLLVLTASAMAQVAVAPIINPHVQFLDSTGKPLSGGKVYTYSAGTTTPKSTYVDSGGVTTNSNPIILDSGGFADIWLGPYVYKIVVKTSADVTVKSVDNVSSLSLTAALNVANTFTQPQVVKALNGKPFADQYPGATADAQIASCLSTYDVCDATGYGTATKVLAGSISVAAGKKVIFSRNTKFVPASSSSTVINLSRGATIEGLHVSLTSYASTYTGNVVDFPCVDGSVQEIGAKLDLLVDGAAGASGTALKMYCSINLGGHAFNDMTVKAIGLANPVKLSVTGTGSWINSNTFNLDLTGPTATTPVTCLSLVNTGLEMRGNEFNGQCEGNGVALSFGVSAVGVGGASYISANHFNMQFWDVTTNWSGDAFTVRNTVEGNLDGVTVDNGITNCIQTPGPLGPNCLKGVRLAAGTDLNTLLGYGSYDVATNAPNQPTYFNAIGGFVHIVNIPTSDSSYITQFAYDMSHATALHVFMRRKVAGTWGAWAEMPNPSSATGTGNVVLATSPTLVTPVLGVASATSISMTGGTAPVVATPTVNQVVCVKSVGPPYILGYCTGAVSGSSACTCN